VIGREVSHNQRVQVLWEDNQVYSLDVRRIMEVRFASPFYYILYDTGNVSFYQKYVASPPASAVELKFEIREEVIGGKCPRCGRFYPLDIMEEMEFADGSAYCLKCLDYTGNFYHLNEVKRQTFEIRRNHGGE